MFRVLIASASKKREIRLIGDFIAEGLRKSGVYMNVLNIRDIRDITRLKEYDAIVLDLAMPKMDGIQTLKKLLEENPDLQIILLTGHATMDKAIEAVKQGAAEFLEKPADINLLIEKITIAQDKKTLLFEKRMEDAVSEIMKKRGW